MTHGQFYLSEKLVDVLHQVSGGVHPGFRPIHAQGRVYRGTFTASTDAKRFTRAVHMQGQAVPTTIRYSLGPGDPAAPPDNTIGMACKFYLPDGRVTDLLAVNHKVFPARTPEEFVELFEALRPEPATGTSDMARLGAFLDSHPQVARAVRMTQADPAPVSFAQTAFHALHAFRFVNAQGQARYARYHWLPRAEQAGQSLEELQSRPQDSLFRELEDRLRRAAAVFTLALELAEEGDPTDDPTVLWPEGRQMVTIGSLEVAKPVTPEEIGDPVLVHDPTHVTDGIELSDDPILQARRGAYDVSVAQRTGGWQQRWETAQRQAMGASHRS